MEKEITVKLSSKQIENANKLLQIYKQVCKHKNANQRDEEKIALLTIPYNETKLGIGTLVENLNYTTVKRLRGVFTEKMQSLTDEQIQAKYVNNPKALANFIYGGRGENTDPNDGWKFIGRGLNQITFKEGYRKAQEAVFSEFGEVVDFVNHPELLENVDYAAKAFVSKAYKTGFTGARTLRDMKTTDGSHDVTKMDSNEIHLINGSSKKPTILKAYNIAYNSILYAVKTGQINLNV